MRLIQLPTFPTILLDIAAWAVIHMAIAVMGSKLHSDRFHPARPWFRARHWERDGEFYVRIVRIREWKRYLPDGARVLGQLGFPKHRLADTSAAYLTRFIAETCRAEWVHWLILASSPLFFLWNKPVVGTLMVAYAAVENLPLIAAQRYNRLRMMRVLARRQAADAR